MSFRERLNAAMLLLVLSCSASAAEITTLLKADDGVSNPYGLCTGPDGALYICDIDHHVIHRFSEGKIERFIGSGRKGYAGDGGGPRDADLNEPYEVRFDREGNVYWVEMRNNVVRRLSAVDKTVSTVAGTGAPGFSGDGGPANKARLNQPHSIQLDPAGNLYVCDIGNHRIRKVDARSGLISTFAGNGRRESTPDGSRFAEAPLHGPRAMDFDAEGNMWLVLREGNALYRLDPRSGTIHHVAGTGAKGVRNGPAGEATLSGPKGISIGPDGNIYFTDTEGHSIRRLNRKANVVELIVGTGERGNGPDGEALGCKLARPHGIFIARDGTMYIGDSENNRVRTLKLPSPQ